MKQNVELIDDEEVITLYDENNQAVEFYEVACIEYEDEFYALLQPVKPIDGIGEDEALIFKLKEQDDETDLFEPVFDEKILEAVFNEYIKAVADEDSECGCGCGNCHDEGGCSDEECEHCHSEPEMDCSGGVCKPAKK